MLDRQLFAAQLKALSGVTEAFVGDITRFDSIDAIAADVLARAPARFALIGLSMGGIVALEIWRRARDRITHLGLLDTTPHVDRPDRQALRLEQIAAVDNGGLRELVVDSLKPRYLAPKNRGDKRLLQSIVDMALALGPDVFRRQSLALRERRASVETLTTVDCPALVLCGREDELCPPEIHAAMASAMPRADLIVLAECGHLSTMEEPDAVNDALRRLLRRSS